jgi:peptidyl-prolyl cis-trans isomerase SurA
LRESVTQFPRISILNIPIVSERGPRPQLHRILNMRRGTLLILVTLVVGVLTLSPGWAEVYSDKIAARVNGDLILSSEIKRFKDPFIRSFFAQLHLGVVPPGKWPTEKEILDELIVIRLIEQEAKQKGITITDQQVIGHADMIKKRHKITHDEFIEQIASKGLTFADYKGLMKQVLTLMAVFGTEIEQKVPIREEEAQEYFKEHKNDINKKIQELMERMTPARPPSKEPERPKVPTHMEQRIGGSVKLRQITLKPGTVRNKPEDPESFRERVVQIYEELQSGAVFATVAKKHSQDKWAQKGGEVGWMTCKDMRQDMQDLMARLKKGVVSQPVGTTEGAMMFLVEDEKGRTVTKKPIPEEKRRELQKQIDEAYDQNQQQRKKAEEEQAKGKDGSDQEDQEGDPKDGKDTGPPKSLGILSEEEEKQYAKSRKKVMAILKLERSQKRLNEWLDELKKRSIIDVKI